MNNSDELKQKADTAARLREEETRKLAQKKESDAAQLASLSRQLELPHV